METFRLPHEHSGNNNQIMRVYCRFKSGCGADLNVSGKKPLSQGEMQIHFGVDKGTVQTPAPPGASSASRVPRMARKHTRS